MSQILPPAARGSFCKNRPWTLQKLLLKKAFGSPETFSRKGFWSPKASTWKIAALFFLFWYGILILTGTMFSGYHFMDDHGILKESKDVADSTFLREVKIFKNNLLEPQMRFRPFYWVHRRFMLAVMGTDFTALSIYIGMLAVLTSWFLYLFMRKIGFSLVEAVLFVLLTLLGQQAEVWWRLGNNETLGMFLLSIALLFMVFGVEALSKRKKVLCDILFVVFVILASWSKESFILMIPALVFGKICLTYEKFLEVQARGAGTLLNILSTVRLEPLQRAKSQELTANSTVPGRRRQKLDAVKENLIPGIVLLLVCVWELVLIFKRVGTTGVGYAGYEGFRVSAFLRTGLQGFRAVQGWVIVIQVAITGIMVYLNSKENKESKPGLESVKSLEWPVVLAGLMVVPQILLYMKSGMAERYLLPGIMGYTFLMVVLARYNREQGGKKIFSIIMIVLLMGITLQQLRVTRYTAMGFAAEGREINGWLRSIEENTDEQDMILVIAHLHKHYEGAISLKTYLDMKSNRQNTLFLPADLKEASAKGIFWNDLNSSFLSKFREFSLEKREDRERFRAILIFPGLEEKFLKASASWFKVGDFKRYTNAAGYVSYYKAASHFLTLLPFNKLTSTSFTGNGLPTKNSLVIDNWQLSIDNSKFYFGEFFSITFFRPGLNGDQKNIGAPSQDKLDTFQAPPKYPPSSLQIHHKSLSIIPQAPLKYPPSIQHTLNILSFCEKPRKRNDIQEHLSLKDRKHFTIDLLKPLLETGLLKPSFLDKPKSPLQKYVTTEKGKNFLKKSLE